MKYPPLSNWHAGFSTPPPAPRGEPSVASSAPAATNSCIYDTMAKLVEHTALATDSLQVPVGWWAELQLPLSPDKYYTPVETSRKTVTKTCSATNIATLYKSFLPPREFGHFADGLAVEERSPPRQRGSRRLQPRQRLHRRRRPDRLPRLLEERPPPRHLPGDRVEAAALQRPLAVFFLLLLRPQLFFQRSKHPHPILISQFQNFAKGISSSFFLPFKHAYN